MGEKWKRFLALLLTVAMIMSSSSMTAFAETIGGYVVDQNQQTDESEAPETAETDENGEAADKKLVTFTTDGHASIFVKGEPVGSEGYAENGEIVFTIALAEGYEVASVIMDGFKELAPQEDGSYKIGNIQTNETTVAVTTQAVETETESESESELAKKSLAMMAAAVSRTVGVDEQIEIRGTDGRDHSWKITQGSRNIRLSNTNGQTVTVTGLREGTATIKHSYKTGSFIFERDNEETYTIEVVRAGQRGNYKLYCYTLVPGKNLNSSGTPDSIWNGMGVGSINAVNPASKPNSTILGSDEYTINRYPSYPNITVDGRTYRYAETGSAQATQQGYYTIEWIRVIVSDGANAGNNGYNEVVANGKATYHLDGQIFLNEKSNYTVTFRIQQPESDVFEIQENYSRRVEDGYRERDLSRPSTADKFVEGKTYKFDGWYYDEACTQKANFTGRITSNTNYYGKYVVNEDELSYDANGGEGTMAPTVGTPNGNVRVSQNTFTRTGYEFTGWNTQANGEGRPYSANSYYRLTDRDDVLYAQWERQTGNLSITKEVKGPKDAQGIFTFTVSGDFGDTKQIGEYEVVNGALTVSVPAGETVTLNGLPTGAYTVAEQNVTDGKVEANGHTYTVNQASKNVTVSADDTARVSFTNTIADTKEITVEKIWEDNGDVYDYRPNDFTVTLTAGNNEYTVQANDWNKDVGDTWTATLSDVAVYNENGQPLIYTVSEAGNGLDKYGQPANKTFTPAEADQVSLTNTLKTGSLTISKEVEGPADAMGEFTFRVTGSNGYNKTVQVAAGESETINDIPAGSYTVTEELPDNGYAYNTAIVVGDRSQEGRTRKNVAVRAGDVTTISYTNTVVTVTVDDLTAKLNADKVLTGRALEAEEFGFQVLKGTTVIAEGTNAAAADGAAADITFALKDGDALTFDKAGTYQYTVKEVEGSLPNVSYDDTEFTVTINVTKNEAGTGLTAEVVLPEGGIVFNNEYNRGTVEAITGTKTWIDGSNSNKIRPESIELTLLADGKVVPVGEGTDVQLTWSNTDQDVWTYTYSGEGLYKNAENGSEIVYTVTEAQVSGYEEPEISGFDITNRIADNNDVTVTGTKTWVDGNNAKRPENETLELSLYRTSAQEGAVEETVSNVTPSWEENTYTFSGLEQYDDEGFAYTYRVDETAIPEGYEKTVNGNNITNTLKTGTLTIEKTVNKPEDLTITDSFAFEVSGFGAGAAVTDNKGNSYTSVDGKITVSVAAGESLTLTVPTGSYTVSESGAEDNKVTVGGHTYRVMEASKTAEVTPGTEEKVTFTNTIADQKTVTVTKTWDDQSDEYGLRPAADEFAVTLTEGENSYTTEDWNANGNTWTTTLTVPAYDANGQALTYAVSETELGAYDRTGDTDFTPAAETDNNVSLLNTLKTGSLTISKTVTGLDEEKALDDTFTFQVSKDGKLLKSKELKSGADHTFTGLPLGTYTVTESVKEGAKHVYDASAKVDGEAAEAVGGGYEVTVDANGAEIAFTNAAKSTAINWAEADLQAFKKLTGRDLEAEEFGFQITDEAGEVVASGTNAAAADGAEAAITFDGVEMTFDTVGTYTYSISEVIPADNKLGGVTYDTDTAEVTITVTAGEDGLTADVQAEKVVFENVYNTEAASVAIQGKKILQAGERRLEAGEFTFEIVETDADGKTLDQAETATAVNSADGTFSHSITYQLADTGTHYYKVSEQKPEVPEEGMIYDETVYTVEVEVTDKGDGTLSAVITEGGDDIVFTNTYEADGTYQIQATKTLNGRALADGEFKFSLQPKTTGAPMPAGAEVAEAYNAASSWVTFEAIAFDESHIGKSFDYTVKEIPGSLNGVTYDTTEHTVRVTVTDAKNGGLTIKQDVVPELENTFDQGTTTVSGTKIWIDGDNEQGIRPDNEDLTIELYRKAGDGERELVTDAEGKAVVPTWNENTYTFSDLEEFDENGNPYTYEVEEAQVEKYAEPEYNGFDITNRIADDEAYSISGTKTWVDGNNAERPENETLELTLYRRSETVQNENLGTVTPQWDENTYTIGNLERYDDAGYAYTYWIEETKVNGYDEPEYDETHLNVTNTITQDNNVVVQGTKTWVMPKNMKHPAVTIQLYRDNEETPIRTISLDEGTARKQFYVFTELPKYAVGTIAGYNGALDGHEFVYTVKEVAVEGYTTTQNGDSLTNTIVQANDVTAEGTKTWVMPENMEHPAATIELYRDNEETPIQTITLGAGADKEQAYRFENLPRYAVGTIAGYNGESDGHEFVYTVKEAKVEGYTSEAKEDGAGFTNTIAQDAVTKTVTKTWETIEGETVPAVTFNLLRDGVKVNEVILTAGTTTHTFEELPRYAVGEIEGYTGAYDGHEFVYTIEEADVNGYDSEGDAATGAYTNTAETTSVEVIKNWLDGDGNLLAAEEIPETLEIQLLKNGKAYGGATPLSGETNWAITFEGLPTHDEEGVLYSWSVSEEVPEGYTAKASTVQAEAKGDGTYAVVLENTKNDETEQKPEKTHVLNEIQIEGTTEMVPVGGTVTYTISYYNHQNKVVDVTITDALPAGLEFVEAAPEATVAGQNVTWTINDVKPFTGGEVTVTVRVTEEALNGANPVVENKATVGLGDVTQDSNGDEIIVANPDWTVDKTVSGMTGEDGKAVVGDELTYTITIANTGNVTITEPVTDTFTVDGEEVTLTLTPAEGSQGTYADGNITLAAGETAVLTSGYTVTETDNQLVNTVKVGDGPEDPDKEITTEVEDKEAWTVDKTVEGMTGEDGKAVVGDELTYTITIENTGNVEITKPVTDTFTVDGKEVTLTLTPAEDSQGTYADGNITLAEGETAVLTSSYTVTETDNKLINTVKVGDGPEDPDKEITTDVEDKEAWTVDKTVAGMTGEDGKAVAGDVLTYTITIANTGNVKITKPVTDTFTVDGKEVVLTLTPAEDSQGTYEGGSITLEEGETAVLTSSYTVAETDSALLNAVKVGTDPEDPGKEVPVEVTANPAMALTKETTSQAAGEAGYGLNEEITYRITTTNTGNRVLENVVLTDAKTGDEWKIDTFAPGETKEFTASYTVQEADLVAGSVTNTVVETAQVGGAAQTAAEGQDTAETPETLTAEASVTDQTAAAASALNMTKTLINAEEMVDGVFLIGSTLRYEIAVRNDGNVTLTNVEVRDVMTAEDGTGITSVPQVLPGEGYQVAANNTAVSIASLAPGAEVRIQVECAVAAEDAGKALINNAIGTAESPIPGDTPDGSAVTDPSPIEELDIPDPGEGGLYEGEVTVEKHVTKGGKAEKVNDTIYVGIFTDKACTQMVEGMGVQPIILADASEGATVFTGLASDGTYYIAEVDEAGTPVQSLSNGFKYTVMYTDKKVVLTEENPFGTVSIENQIPDGTSGEGDDEEITEEVTEVETEIETEEEVTETKKTTAARTGDNTNLFILFVLLILAGAAGSGAVIYKKKRAGKSRR